MSIFKACFLAGARRFAAPFAKLLRRCSKKSTATARTECVPLPKTSAQDETSAALVNRLYDTKVALRNVDLIDNRLEGTVQTLTSASSETEERLFVRWSDDGWTSIKNTEASKVAPNIYSFVIERTAGSTVKMAIKYIIGEHELWDTNHFHDFTF
eukprot:Em0004g801a